MPQRRVGLVTSSFQFFSSLAAVFAEEFGSRFFSSIQRCAASAILRVYIRTSSNELFHGFDVTTASSSSDCVAVVGTPAP